MLRELPRFSPNVRTIFGSLNDRGEMLATTIVNNTPTNYYVYTEKGGFRPLSGSTAGGTNTPSNRLSQGGYVAGSQNKIALPGEDFQFIHSDPTKRISLLGVNATGLVAGGYNGKPAFQRLNQDPQVVGSINGCFSSLNNKGQAIGKYTPAGTTTQRQCMWTEGKGFTYFATSEEMTNPILADSGWIAGTWYDSSQFGSQAAVWRPGKGLQSIHMPGADNSYPLDMNSQGLVVGNVDIARPGDHTPFIWSETTGMLNLRERFINPRSGAHYIWASSISESGSILIYSDEKRSGASDYGYYYLATPVPEPSSWVLIVGMFGLGRFQKRQR